MPFFMIFFFLYQTACAVLFRVSLNLFDGGLMSSIKWMHIHQFRSNEIQTQTQTEKKKTYTYKSKHKISNKKKKTQINIFFFTVFVASFTFPFGSVCVCVFRNLFLFFILVKGGIIPRIREQMAFTVSVWNHFNKTVESKCQRWDLSKHSH